MYGDGIVKDQRNINRQTNEEVLNIIGGIKLRRDQHFDGSDF